MLTKRTVLIGAYDTAANGWTLTGYKLSDPDQKTNYTERRGGDGSWDLSTVLTDGIPTYNDRSLVVTLECSEGDRYDREKLLSQMVNSLDGLEWHIVLPDHPDHYLTGRVHVAVDYSNLAHAAVTVTAICAPWLYKAAETVVELTAAAGKQTATLTNAGRQAVIPILSVTGEGASVLLAFGSASKSLSAGVYQWPELMLKPGEHTLTYSGSGALSITYREAVLR